MVRGKAWIASVAIALSLTAGVSTAHADAIEVTVLGTAGPWDWATGGLNAAYHYGPEVQDFTPPTVVDLQTLGLAAGDSIYISYKSGLTSAFGGEPYVDQAGHVGSIFKDDVPGSSGQPFPSLHMPAQWGSGSADAANDCSMDPLKDCRYGIFLNSLVATLTDANHVIVGTPFPIGYVLPVETAPGSGIYTQGFNVGLDFQLPSNARYLQLGMNDDLFNDNTGSLQVCVGSNQSDQTACLQNVPDQASTVGLFAIGLVGLAALGLYRGHA